MTNRIAEISEKIKFLESQEQYLNSMIALCMAEANMLDKEIEAYTASGLSIRAEIKDLQAELRDTI